MVPQMCPSNHTWFLNCSIHVHVHSMHGFTQTSVLSCVSYNQHCHYPLKHTHDPPQSGAPQDVPCSLWFDSSTKVWMCCHLATIITQRQLWHRLRPHVDHQNCVSGASKLCVVQHLATVHPAISRSSRDHLFGMYQSTCKRITVPWIPTWCTPQFMCVLTAWELYHISAWTLDSPTPWYIYACLQNPSEEVENHADKGRFDMLKCEPVDGTSLEKWRKPLSICTTNTYWGTSWVNQWLLMACIACMEG